MRTRRPRASDQWPAWYYSPKGVGAVFDCPEDVPEGWVSRSVNPDTEPAIPDKSLRLDHDAIVHALVAKGIPIHPLYSTARLKELLDGVS